MMPPSHLDSLRDHAARLEGHGIGQLLNADPARASDFAVRVGPLYANFARQGYDREALAALIDCAERGQIHARVQALFDGEPVNATEGRAALHTALRGDLSAAVPARAAHAQALQMRARMAELVEAIVSSGIRDVVSIGIGGSDLGPRLVVDALSPAQPQVRVHFLSNVDGHAAQRLLLSLDSAHTAVLLISKSFRTQETLLNGVLLRDWLGDDRRLYAITADPPRAAQFGIAPERVLPMWDWVGGRYSVWSAVGMPVALAIGMQGFDDFCAGAAEIDAHVLQAPYARNLPVLHALTAVWNRNAAGHATQAVLAYDERLKLMPAYLQQLVMESLGKSARADGSSVEHDTVPVWWGGVGSDTQHSFFQALHQGTQVVPCDFIGVVQADHPYPDSHRALLANLLAQTEALANGHAADDPHRAYAGGRPSTLLLLDALTPRALGALLAVYEHSVYVQSVVWGINAFDQFGVELGKQIADGLLPALQDEAGAAADPVTRVLLAELAARR